MTIPVVECIPNFSEARKPDVIEAIAFAIKEVVGVNILNISSDQDHNRTVITFVGPPQAVEEAAFLAIDKAARLINLDNHEGSHPRLGATDVVPFVPISGVDMSECVQMARRLGERVGRELNIPVYLYENAASRPDRVNLEDVRRGQYEGLKKEIKINPDRAPDFGPKDVGTAGASIIGARPPLIAFNVYLTSNDISIAKAISKTIRNSSGGYRFVKGLGMLVDGRAQISMNLTNFRQTSVHRVVEAIRREAAHFGESIHHCELVGLIPGEALLEAAAWYLQLNDFDLAQVLENRLNLVKSESITGYGFLDAVASGDPTPGGGSAAAFSGAMGAALVAMVARLTCGKKRYTDVESQMLEILHQAEKLRSDLSSSIEEDASAFKSILHAIKLPKDNDELLAIRQQAIEESTLKAAQVPLQTAKMAVKVMALAERCVAIGNINAISDAASAFAMERAALTSAGYNVRINTANLLDKRTGDLLVAQLASLEASAALLEQRVKESLVQRGGISL